MKSKYFDIEELVPLEVFNKRGQSAWELINPKLIETIDKIKETFKDGTITINNYKWGGSRNESGLRTSNCANYSPTSQHSLGNAVDCVFSDYSALQVRQYIIDNINYFPYIKGIEDDVAWLHIDCRNREDLLIFKP